MSDDEEFFWTACTLDFPARTKMPVPPCMERAFGYTGNRRLVAFAQTKPGYVSWWDGIDHGHSAVTIWETFIKHPLTAPHLTSYRFRCRLVEPEELTVFESPTQALRIELEECGDAILVDRRERVALVGPLVTAIVLVDTASLPEMMAAGDEDDDGDLVSQPITVDSVVQKELIDWLDSEFRITQQCAA